MINYLEWDSHFFGYKVGKIYISDLVVDLQVLLQDAQKHHYKLLYVRIANQALFQTLKAELEKWGKWVDERITFLKDISHLQNKPQSAFVKDFQELQPTAEMYALALRSGEYSRFRLDSSFQNKEFERLYTIWLERSVAKQIADKVLVYEKDSKVVGMVTLAFQEGISKVGLVAVDKDFEGQGIGYELFQVAFEQSKQNNCKQMWLTTQGANHKACEFYKKLGFEIQKKEYTYHIWL